MKKLSALALMCAVLASPFAVAHGGGTDAYGCHLNHKTGVYHCH